MSVLGIGQSDLLVTIIDSHSCYNVQLFTFKTTRKGADFRDILGTQYSPIRSPAAPPFVPPVPSPPLEVGPLHPDRESREHCKFTQWDVGRNPSRNRI